MSMTVGTQLIARRPPEETNVFKDVDFLRNLPKYRDAGPYTSERAAFQRAGELLSGRPYPSRVDIYVRSHGPDKRDFYVVERDRSNPDDTASTVEALRQITGSYYVTPHAVARQRNGNLFIEPTFGRPVTMPLPGGFR